LELVSAAGRLSRGDFTTRACIQTGDERDQLIHAFNEMVPKLEDHMRLHESMRLATEVQQNLLPQQDPTFPGLDIAGISIYCDETGGDYYDFMEISKDPTDMLVVAVGDVSGHGVHSALLMASARASLRLRAALPGTLTEMVSDVNRQFTEDVGDSGSFMTLFLLRIDWKAKALSWVGAGHDPACCYHPQADTFEELCGIGPAMGFEKNAIYEERTKTGLNSGDVVVIGTDGIWETVNANGEMFGKARLCNIIRGRHTETARDIIQAVIRALEDFRHPLKPSDDITIVVIKITADNG
jgi:sigma-B regulation protein RsbU (phosphoserine phosphatase)